MESIVLLREGEVAAALGVCVRTVQSWRVRGEGPVFRKVGRCVRYVPDDLKAFIDAGRRTSTSGGVDAARECRR